MTIQEKTDKEDNKFAAATAPTEPEIVATAIPTGYSSSFGGAQDAAHPIPEGHARFYCSKCHTPYDLPANATSWRCPNCMEFNSITPGECPWCTIM